MSYNDIESELARLGHNWPIASVADSVAKRLESLPRSLVVPTGRSRWRLTVIGSVVTALALFAAVWITLLSSPTTLYAQVEQAVRNAKSVHVLITTIDGQDRRLKADMWYSRGHGLRLESPDEILVDDGRQQWGWNPKLNEAERVVSRRASRDAAGMIADSLQLGGAPADWKQSRAAEFDREIAGNKCEAVLVEPPGAVKSVAYGDSTPSPLRFIAWLDAQKRVVQVEDQRQVGNTWKVRREMRVEYDVEIAAEKFVAQFPATTKIVDEDGLWADRFPLDKALATVQKGGLLFAVHEVVRCEGEMFFIVSSVRGTSEHLKQFPPQRRRLNLQTTILDVAEHNSGASVLQECHQVAMTAAESAGVHYMWWIAAPRKYFQLKDGVQVPQDGVGTRLEFEPGRIRIPLNAYYRDARMGNKQENAHVEVKLPSAGGTQTLVEIARRVRRDAMVGGEGTALYGGIENDTVRILRPANITDVGYAEELQSQLKWLRSYDKLGDATLSGPPGPN